MKRLLPYIVIVFSLAFIVIQSCSKEEITVYELTSDVTPLDGGYINPSQGTFDSGEQVSIAAFPSQGYSFKSWSGNISGTNNPHTFKIISDTKAIAIFIEDDTDEDGVSDLMDECPNTPLGASVNALGCSDTQEDSDGDSVNDDVDLCSNTPVGESVDADGCSDSQKDTDSDGITDDLDECLDTEEGLTVDDKGCAENQLDSDNDGVNDDADQCPMTPESETVNASGCSTTQMDSDADGVTDDLDTCPDTPSGESVDTNGCSNSQKDSDGDGVKDDVDQCQNTPSGETVDSTGCSDTQVDTDGDTITDDLDQCPNTPTGETVDAQGCSDSQKDTDGDGVNDDLDICPNTPSGEGVNSNGCSSSQEDTDNDGVADNIDQCPGTPSGESVDAIGCSDSQKDSDVDGVSDDKDQCPNTPTGETVDSNGCSSNQNDSDGDGVTDDLDLCPNTQSGATVDFNGCADSQKDTDGDGVSDDIDLCSGTPSGETVDVNGCSDSQKDSDSDGVTDDEDTCPDTPNGESVNAEGCSSSQTDQDGDGISDNIDTCPNTPSGETVDSNGCADSQNDTQPPVVTSITVTTITSTSFTVDWSLDEGSKGYIRFGTSPGVYVGSTAIENNYLTRHIQTVGGTNPAPLIPNTAYYWQIYVEDQFGNTGFSEEQTTITLEEVARTYIPDDQFEQNLIYQGYDDVLDNYVLTANIENILVLTLSSAGDFDNPSNTYYEHLIQDFTGLEDFRSLQEINFAAMFTLTSQNIDLSGLINLRKIVFRCTSINGIDLTKNELLEEFRFEADSWSNCPGTISNLDLSYNTNLKTLKLSAVDSFDDLNLLLSRATSVENLYLSQGPYPGDSSISLVNNINLRTLQLGGDPMYLVYIDLKNGANEKLERIDVVPLLDYSDLCIEANLPSYVNSITFVLGWAINVNVTDDCGF